MKKTASILCVIGILGTWQWVNGDVDRRTLNNGNLVLEDIPDIPQSVVDDLNRYQNTRGAGVVAWSQSGESLYISTRFAELNQLHRVDMPGGARHQLTYFQERYSGANRHPKNDRFLIGMDRGGSEFYQIYSMEVSTGELRLLTDGKSRNGGSRWNRDGSAFSYTSTRRNGKSNDVWMMDPEQPEQARMIVESSDGSSWGVADWNKAGNLALVSRYVGNQDARIYLLDIATSKRELFEGSTENVSINYALGFTADEKGYFFATNQKNEFQQLAYREFGSDEIRILTKDIPWDVDGGSFNEERDRAAFVVNEGGMSALYLFNPKTMRYRRVEGLPVGLIGGLEFSPDGRRLAMVQNNARSSSDAYVLDLGDDPLDYGKITRWTYSETGGLDSERFAMPELIQFKSFDGRMIPAFVSKPEGEGPFPVVIDIHGGPESQRRPYFSSSVQMQIDKLGVAVIQPNVRGSRGYGIEYMNLDNGYRREDSVKDIGALLDWIKAQDDLDESRVAVTGGSYGGYMVLACATHFSDRLVAAVDVVGISNFVTFLENTEAYRRDIRRAEYGDERNPEMRAFLNQISPNRHIDKIDIPLLVVQGKNDPRVPVTESEQMVKALRENGKTVWYMLGNNEGHGFAKKENRDVYEQVKFLFLEKYLVGRSR